jgi:DNA-binding transcriptional LysR family regulator
VEEVSMSITPTGKLTLSNIEAVAESVKNGLGIGCVGQWHVQEAIETGSVIELLRKFRPAPLDVKVYYSSRTHLPKKVRVFIDFLLAQAPLTGQL